MDISTYAAQKLFDDYTQAIDGNISTESSVYDTFPDEDGRTVKRTLALTTSFHKGKLRAGFTI